MPSVDTSQGVVEFDVLQVVRLTDDVKTPVMVIFQLPGKNLRVMFALDKKGKPVIPPLDQARKPLDPSKPTDYTIGGDHLYPALVRQSAAILKLPKS